VIEISGLRKTFRGVRAGKRLALDSLDLVVEPGRVHGFLGPNGSGKTTTIRILLGLASSDGGQLTLLGHEVPRELPQVIGQVGAVVESPQFFPHFSGRRNLRLLASIGGVRRRKVDEVLELVGLRDRAKDRVKGYSLGMRQRLAIAATLLREPRLLILDEPNNGLDPAGIREVRELMRNLADSGVTVLLSSHLLAEVQQVCDSVSIISRGRHIVTGPVSEVLASGESNSVRVGVSPSELDQAGSLLAAAGLTVRREGDHLVASEVADPAWITQVLAKHRLYVSELAVIEPDLESVFLQLTGVLPSASPPTPAANQPGAAQPISTQPANPQPAGAEASPNPTPSPGAEASPGAKPSPNPEPAPGAEPSPEAGLSSDPEEGK
jgi:ABC-2 type transport system ATP-binding protein